MTPERAVNPTSAQDEQRDTKARAKKHPRGTPQNPVVPGLGPFLTPTEVGEVLRLSTKRTYDLMADDPSFPVTRLKTGTIRVSVPLLQVWLQEQTQGRRRMLSPVRPVGKPMPDNAEGTA